MAQIKVIHLEIEGEHYYFGSPKAMFDIMGKDRMGMTYQSFHSNVHLKMDEPYVNRRRGYIIRVGYMGQAKTNRNSRKNYIPVGSLPTSQTPATPSIAEENLNPFASAPNPTMAPAAESKPVAKESKSAESKRKKKEKDIPEQLTLF